MLEFMWSNRKELRLHFLWNVLNLTDEVVSLKEFFLRFCRCQSVQTCHLKDVAWSVNSQVVFLIRHCNCAMDMSIHTHTHGHVCTTC